MSNTPFPTSSIIDGNKLLLSDLASKIKTGRDLTLAESYMGVVSSQLVTRPDISNYKVNGDVLPEVV